MQQADIRIVGVGGAGCRIAEQVVDAVRGRATVVAVNTDARALGESRAATRLQIGPARTGGLGSGGDAAVGRLAAEDDVEMVRGLFTESRFVLVVAGMGGGTGTGAAPIILREARATGALTLCLATLPCTFEGASKRVQAKAALEELRAAGDAVIVVPTDRLFESVGAADLAGTFRRADGLLGACICSLVKLIGEPGQINLDFADVQGIVRHSGGACTIGCGEGRGEAKAQEALDALLGSPLLEKGRVVAKAGSLLVSIVGGPDLTVKDVGSIMTRLSSAAREGCHVSMGAVLDDDWRDRVTITVIAAEQWKELAAPKVAEPGVVYEQQAPAARRGRNRSKAKPEQAVLRLDVYGKGRFKDIEPTILDGEDLDTPSFLRRGIPIDK